jgi:hypothetical protein
MECGYQRDNSMPKGHPRGRPEGHQRLAQAPGLSADLLAYRKCGYREILYLVHRVRTIQQGENPWSDILLLSR